MNRRAAGRLILQGGGACLLAGCEGLDLSAEGEGTGIQVITGLTILAKYRANQAQKMAAEQAGRRAFVALAMKPAMQKEAKTRQAKVAAKKENAPPPPVAAAPSKVESTSSTDAAFASAWRKTAETYQMSGESAAAQVSMPESRGGVAFAPLTSQSILTASSAHAPNYFAVSVPPQGAPGESGAGDVVMLWDARQRRLAGDLAYAVKEHPKQGQQVKIDGRAAVYVGRPAMGGL
jgi:hypothetical protein